MNAPATPAVVKFDGDASLGAVLSALEPYADKVLVIEYGGRTIRPGYHVTEVKAGSFVTLDCGGNPDAWSETILQVEDLGPQDDQDFMLVAKFRGILGKVAERVALDTDARLTFEIGPPELPMQVFDVDTLHLNPDKIVLRLAPRAAICKPRHRAAKSVEATCCTPSAPKCCG
jgi:hypothetical protein